MQSKIDFVVHSCCQFGLYSVVIIRLFCNDFILTAKIYPNNLQIVESFLLQIATVSHLMFVHFNDNLCFVYTFAMIFF